jgi:hypothetical protein
MATDQPVKGQGLTTEYAAGVVVIGSLILLILIRRGFRGINIGGVGVSVR